MADILSQDELDALLTEMQIEDNLDEPVEAASAAEIDPAPVVERRPEAAGRKNIELILNLPVNLSVELGRTRMTVGDMLQLGQGSVIELQRMANDLIDLTINAHVLAQGEAVVVNENFGFRVVEVDSVRDRIRKL